MLTIVIVVGVAIIVLSIVVSSANAAANNKTVKCGNCSWRGTMKRWKESAGCPSCHSDLRARE